MKELFKSAIRRFVILDFNEGFGDFLMLDDDDDDYFSGNEDYDDEEGDLSEDLEDMNLY